MDIDGLVRLELRERPMAARRAGKEIVVRGIVGVKRDTRSGIVDVRLRPFDGDAFRILPDQIGFELANCMDGAFVEVTGVPIPSRRNWLSVTGFHCDTFFSGDLPVQDGDRGSNPTPHAA